MTVSALERLALVGWNRWLRTKAQSPDDAPAPVPAPQKGQSSVTPIKQSNSPHHLFHFLRPSKPPEACYC